MQPVGSYEIRMNYREIEMLYSLRHRLDVGRVVQSVFFFISPFVF
jgi:hypothetical protein